MKSSVQEASGKLEGMVFELMIKRDKMLELAMNLLIRNGVKKDDITYQVTGKSHDVLANGEKVYSVAVDVSGLEISLKGTWYGDFEHFNEEE